MLLHLSKDGIMWKGISGSVLFGFASEIYKHIGPIIGIASGFLGLYLVILSIIQKRREMKKWRKENSNI